MYRHLSLMQLMSFGYCVFTLSAAVTECDVVHFVMFRCPLCLLLERILLKLCPDASFNYRCRQWISSGMCYLCTHVCTWAMWLRHC